MNPTATATANGATSATSSPIAARVAELRELAAAIAAAAQATAWAWIQELGKRRDADQLGELYKLGNPPTGLDGPTEGILVVPLIQGAVDRFVDHPHRRLDAVARQELRRGGQPRLQPARPQRPLAGEAAVAVL